MSEEAASKTCERQTCHRPVMPGYRYCRLCLADGIYQHRCERVRREGVSPREMLREYKTEGNS